MIAEPVDKTLKLATERLVDLLQRYVPDLLTSLDLVGSAVDGDFRPGRSDLDFVAVLPGPATADDIEALTIVHRIYGSDPTLPALDGIWVTTADLAVGPDAAADGPVTHGGAFVQSGRGNRNPITWLALREQSLTVLGDSPSRSGMWHDPERLNSWICENVESYWAGWRRRAGDLLSWRGLSMLGQAEPMWGVLGISRLHYTLATGRIASKAAAGEYALTAFGPRWQRIVKECLRIRRGGRGSFYRNPLTRRRDALDFVGMAMAAIRERYCASE